MKRFILLVSFLYFNLALFAQEKVYTITGQVIDETTKAAIPYTHIFIKQDLRGTVSNELGFFEIEVDRFPILLDISHVSYQNVELSIDEATENLQIVLKNNLLEDVMVVAKRTSESERILLRAIDKVEQNLKEVYTGKAFYRQISKTDTTYNELYEMFYDVDFSTDGIIDWKMKHGRYALLDDDDYVVNKNFTLLNRLFPTLQPDVDLFIMPTRRDATKFYDLKITEIFNTENEDIINIAFTAKEDASNDIPIMNGQIFIDLDDYTILKIVGSFKSNDLELISLKGNGDMDNYTLDYEISFKKNGEETPIIEYVKCRQNFDLQKESGSPKKIETNSLLTFFQYDKNKIKSRSRYSKYLKSRKSDRSKIDRIGYDASFWRDNPIVALTPIEQKVIQSFERRNKFGSIYLNNKEQVSFVQQLDQDPFILDLDKKLKEQYSTPEKIYVHIDKPYYSKEETIHFKAYLTDGFFHRPWSESKVIYVDLIDPNQTLIEQHKLSVDENGNATGDFNIKEGYLEGTYLLRAYTERMKANSIDYIFQKRIMIYHKMDLNSLSKKTENIDFQIFPEGGYLVNDIPSIVAFKAIDQNGNPLAVNGALKDEDNNIISQFKTMHDGMGKLVVRPASSKDYTLSVQYGDQTKQVELPQVLEQGLVMRVNNKKDKNISIKVLASPQFNGSELYLIAHTRGVIYFKARGMVNKQLLHFEVPQNYLVDGILHLTLLDDSGKNYAERLVYIDQTEEGENKITLNKKSSNGKRQINIELLDKQEIPIRASLSVSVSDAEQVNMKMNYEGIKTYLLLSSDLKGQIYQPDYYFDKQNENAFKHLDLVMMTNGWRRFTWQKIRSAKDKIVNDSFEKGFQVCGKIDPLDIPKINSKELSMIATDASAMIYSTTINEDGSFCFHHVNFQDTTQIIIQTKDKKGNSINLQTDFSKIQYPPIANFKAYTPVKEEEQIKVQNYIANNNNRLYEQSAIDGKRVDLDVVEVKADRLEKEKSGGLHGNADFVITMDEDSQRYPDLVQAITGKTPRLQILDDGQKLKIKTLGSSQEPLILVDGQEINVGTHNKLMPPSVSRDDDDPTGGGIGEAASNSLNSSAHQNDLRTILKSYRPEEIDRVEVLTGANAAIYGIRGGNGVVAIYTKRIGEQDNKQTIKRNEFVGYYNAKEFYVPIYSSLEEVKQKDRRSTLLWAPKVNTNSEGKVSLSFTPSDISKKYTIRIEGISPKGYLISKIVNLEE